MGIALRLDTTTTSGQPTSVSLGTNPSFLTASELAKSTNDLKY